MSDNRRGTPRRDAFRVASLFAGDGADAIECLVWDVSGTGAQIEVAGETLVPDRFLLQVSAYEPQRSCRVVRRDGRRMGVQFEG